MAARANGYTLVFTFKEGLLSPLAHDLKLRVTRFSLEVAETSDSVAAEFDPRSLVVLTAMKDGADSPSALPGFARGEIEKNIVNDVLEAKHHSAIRFETTKVTDTAVEGRLTLHGVTKSVTGTRRDEAKRWVAEFRLDQRDFGIKPYSAFLGTLRIRPEVMVRVSLPR